jgi:glyoxylase-like metal-dependent hydrolase (beta-lactamase superfamily II)
MSSVNALRNGSQRWTIGGVTVTTAIERHNQAPAAGFIPGAAAEDLAGRRAWLSPWAVGEAGQLRFAMQAFCLAADGRKILVDTCIGPRRLPGAYAGLADDGTCIGPLTAAGFGRDDVDLVICTHLHFDHVGWNTVLENGTWVPTFRKARYIVAKPEYEHWSAASEHERASSNLHSFDDAILPLFAAGVADLVEADHQVSDAIGLVPTPGHTPGHVSLSIASRGERALITGDCAHHPVQFEEPGWSSVADADPAMSSATRRRLAREYADTPALVLGTHFPPPTAGHLVTTDAGVRFQPLLLRL